MSFINVEADAATQATKTVSMHEHPVTLKDVTAYPGQDDHLIVNVDCAVCECQRTLVYDNAVQYQADFK